MSIMDSLKELSDEETEHVTKEELENSKEVAEIEDQSSRCTRYCICNVLVVVLIVSSSRICVRANVSSVEVELRLSSEEKNKEEENTLTSVVVSGKCIIYCSVSVSPLYLIGLSSSVELVGGTITVGAR